ncbi:hypothetical protein B5X24_HaOG213779 [Helicoverpa armigera]|nr:hypothetical protein B5X24_HaOG213779 [Helicoverpa armigera]
MHHEHDHTVMTCTRMREDGDITVMVKFILAVFENKMTVSIEGMNLRYSLNGNNYSEINYKITPGQLISVVCETRRQDIILQMLETEDTLFKNADVTELEGPNKMSKIMFESNRKFDDKKLRCAFTSTSGEEVLIIEIKFSIAELPEDFLPLSVDIPSEGLVLELTYYKKLSVIYYDFEEGESFKFQCTSSFRSTRALYAELQFLFAAENINETKDTLVEIEHTFKLNKAHAASAISCKLNQVRQGIYSTLREIRVILRMKQLTTKPQFFVGVQPTGSVTIIVSTTVSILVIISPVVVAFFWWRKRAVKKTLPAPDVSAKLLSFLVIQTTARWNKQLIGWTPECEGGGGKKLG